MDVEKVIDTVTNNGVAIGMLVYFIIKDGKWTETINKSLTSIADSMEIIKDMLLKGGGKK